MKYLIGIVSYNPDEKRLGRTLQSLRKMNYSILIVDNGSKNGNVISKICDKYDVNLILNHNNWGIAKALNEIFNFAKNHRFSWVLTFDQDSKINENLLKKYDSCKEKKNVGIYCPIVYDYVSGAILQGKSSPKQYDKIDKCITSGALTSVNAWYRVGGFDEYLFIDEVDNDFCYRLNKKNIKILLINNAVLEHKIGKTRIINFLGKKIIVRNHSAMRKFYITRNQLYLDRKYYGKVRVRTIGKIFLFIIKTLLFETDKSEKLNECKKGFIEGIK